MRRTTEQNNTFSQNSIHSNSGPGIDLTPVGVTTNDAGDSDTGANDQMNYPVLNAAGLTQDGALAIKADLDFNSAEAPFILEFFDNSTNDDSGYGEGQTYIGTVTTSEIGEDILLEVPITGSTPTNFSRITATATNTNGSTSEFSAQSVNVENGDILLDDNRPTNFQFLIKGFMESKKGAGEKSEITVNKRRLEFTFDVNGTGTKITEMKISEHSDFKGNNWRVFDDNIIFELSEGDETKYVYFKFKDAAGNDSKTYEQKIKLDTSKPRVKLNKILALEFLPEYSVFYIISNYASFTGTSDDRIVTVTIDGVRQHYNAHVKLDGSWHIPRFWVGPGTHKIQIESFDNLEFTLLGIQNSEIEFTLVNDPTKQLIPKELVTN